MAVRSIGDTAKVLDRLAGEGRLPDTIVVTTPDLPGQALAVLVEQAERHGVSIRRAPRPTALDATAIDRPHKLELRPMAIEDLLNRPQVPLDRDGMARLVRGRRVLVTGAGGTIGSELARQVAALDPALLVLLDNGEYALWQIDLELAESHPALHRQARIADIRDAARLQAICDEVRPELVFHAAALKHVPLSEANLEEAVLTNAIGTRTVSELCRDAGVGAMVMISTDKAVNPTSVMGATKRLAEIVCQSLQGSGTQFVLVRFGNVFGSAGSVIPRFSEQIARGGPVTVTHPDVIRYFMTIPEAAQLVIQAGSMARGGDVFVLDMGKPIRIVDLARRMIQLSGRSVRSDEHPDGDVEIVYTGLRPAEKLFEELLIGKDVTGTEHPMILRAVEHRLPWQDVHVMLEQLRVAMGRFDCGAARSILEGTVTEYQPSEELQDLVWMRRPGLALPVAHSDTTFSAAASAIRVGSSSGNIKTMATRRR